MKSVKRDATHKAKSNRERKNRLLETGNEGKLFEEEGGTGGEK